MLKTKTISIEGPTYIPTQTAELPRFQWTVRTSQSIAMIAALEDHKLIQRSLWKNTACHLHRASKHLSAGYVSSSPEVKIQATASSSSIKQEQKNPYSIYAVWYIGMQQKMKDTKREQLTNETPTNQPSCGLSPSLASLNLATFS